jgi:hypothetical protein
VTAIVETNCGVIRPGTSVNGTISISGANLATVSIALTGATAGGECL